MQNALKTAAKTPAINVLVHPFFCFGKKRPPLIGYSTKQAREIFDLWRKEVDKAAQTGDYFVFVANEINREYHGQIAKNTLTGNFPAQANRLALEQEFVAYAHKKLGDKLHFIVNDRIITFLDERHLPVLEKKWGFPACKCAQEFLENERMVA